MVGFTFRMISITVSAVGQWMWGHRLEEAVVIELLRDGDLIIIARIGIDPHINGLIFDKGARQFAWERMVFSVNGAGQLNGYPLAKKPNLDLYFTLYTKLIERTKC